jgi:hypothetical protein
MIIQIWGDGHRGLLAVVEAKTIEEALRQYAKDRAFAKSRVIGKAMRAEGRLYVGRKV